MMYYLYSTYRKEKYKDKVFDSLSFEVEKEYIELNISPHLSTAAKSYFEKTVIAQKLLFADWLCQNINLDQFSSVETISYLLTTLVENNIQDNTATMSKLEELMSSKLGALPFADAVHYLASCARVSATHGLPGARLASALAAAISQAPVSHSNSRAAFSQSPLLQLAMLAGPEAASPACKLACAVGKSLAAVADSGHPGRAAKHSVELLHALAADWSPAYASLCDALLVETFQAVHLLQGNDVLVLLRAVLLLRLRSPEVCDLQAFDRRLALLDAQAIMYGREFSPMLVESTAKFVVHSRLVDLGKMPFIASKLLGFKISHPKQIRVTSRSEYELIDYLKEAGVKIKAQNTLIENSFAVDVLLDGAIIEANGRYHYCSEYLRAGDGIPFEVIDKETLAKDPAVLNKYRGTDVIKISALTSFGYKYVSVDVRFLAEAKDKIIETVLSMSK